MHQRRGKVNTPRVLGKTLSGCFSGWYQTSNINHLDQRMEVTEKKARDQKSGKERWGSL